MKLHFSGSAIYQELLLFCQMETAKQRNCSDWKLPVQIDLPDTVFVAIRGGEGPGVGPNCETATSQLLETRRLAVQFRLWSAPWE
jgi:hypothetical protein